jgi:type I restriction-modification system DNA methylase subunit
VRDAVEGEHKRLGFAGRFGAGLPRINDGSFLFLQHMIAKMKPVEEGGSRVAIVFNGSPLFTGAAGSGESEIRRWILENDWLEAVVALPDQLFYNTGISTYFWIVTNRKAPERRGLVQLVDARGSWEKMRKSLGEKRKRISDAQIAEIVRLYGAFEEGERVKILPNEAIRRGRPPPRTRSIAAVAHHPEAQRAVRARAHGGGPAPPRRHRAGPDRGRDRAAPGRRELGEELRNSVPPALRNCGGGEAR